MQSKRFLQLTNMPDLSGLSKDGRDWLTNALDPFHDNPVPIAGIPDGDFGDTVIQTIKKKVTITAPPSANGGRFDVHIFTLPVLSSPLPQSYGGPYPPASAVVGELFGNGMIECSAGLTNNSQPYPMGTVVAIAVPAGLNTFPRFDPTQPNKNGLPQVGTNIPVWYELDAIEVDDDVGGGMSKLVSGGFEVHNDTPELYLGGSVTVYCAPQSEVDYLTLLDPFQGGGSHPANVKCFRGVASNVSDATFYPNSRSWSAKEGCVVPFYLRNHGGFQAASLQVPVARTNDTAYDGQNAIIDHPVVGAPIQNAELALSTSRYCSMQSVGAYFSGLDNASVLTLDVRFTVERRPSVANKMLLSLASPTALLDESALALYDEIRRSLPVGAPVEWNETGKWWQTVLSKVPAAVKAISPLLPPSLRAVGGGVSKLAELGLAASQNREVQAMAKQAQDALAAKRAKKKALTAGQARK
jgi:hypothetical protein